MNDKPILVASGGSVYVPVFRFYPETAFHGEFDTEPDYRSTYFNGLMREQGAFVLWPPHRYAFDTVNEHLSLAAPSPPTWENPLGTDDQGRDVLARLVYGFRISVLFGVVLTALSTVISLLAGGSQGYFGGRYDLFFQRFIEIWSGMPILFLLIILSSFVEPSFWWLLGLLLLFSWLKLVGVVRAEFLRVRNFAYVLAARALGLSNWRIMARHILPNAIVATLTYLPFVLSGAITTLTSLDFLGFGLPPGSPSLGELLTQGKNNLQAPWLGISAFCGVAVPLCLLVFIGEGVRDAFDPHKQYSA